MSWDDEGEDLGDELSRGSDASAGRASYSDYSGGGGGDGDGGPLPPPCAACLGFILFIVSVTLIWMNERDYTMNIGSLRKAMTDAKEPCSRGCSSCNMRDIHAGDLVFVACDLQGLEDASSTNDDFKIKELRPLIKSDARAAKFMWHGYMYQYWENPQTTQTISVDTTGTEGAQVFCRKGAGMNDATDPGHSRRTASCCKGEAKDLFMKRFVGDRKSCQVPYSKGRGSDVPKGCAGRTQTQCILLPKRCRWNPRAFPSLGCEDKPVGECAGLNKENCQAPERQGVCKWDWNWDGNKDWKTSCIPDTGRLVFIADDQILSDEDGAESSRSGETQKPEEGTEPFNVITDDFVARAIEERRLGNNKDTKPRSKFTCSYPCYSWKAGWSHEKKPDPMTWTNFPQSLFARVDYLQGHPASNVNDLSDLQGESSNIASVKVGGFHLSGFNPAIPDALWTDLTDVGLLAKPLGTEKLGAKNVSGPTLVHGPTPYTVYTRDNGSPGQYKWSDQNSRVSGNCIRSNSPTSKHMAGDLKVCFKMASLTKLTILAEVESVNGGFGLKVSQSHLRPNSKVTSVVNGYALRKGELVTKDQLFDALQRASSTALYLQRLIWPCALWLAFYLCLTPIVWFIDKFGDCIEVLPCIGGCLGSIADFIETLADFLICIVSCCCGMVVALIVAGIAWLFYRPLVGATILCVAAAIIAGIVVLKQNQKGAPLARPGRSRRSARQPPIQAAELSTAMPQQMPQLPVQPAPGQPCMMQVVCPPTATAGMPMLVNTPDGRQVRVTVPDGIGPGQPFMVQA